MIARGSMILCENTWTLVAGGSAFEVRSCFVSVAPVVAVKTLCEAGCPEALAVREARKLATAATGIACCRHLGSLGNRPNRPR